jgi:quercetin 2,3-dioxygenase
MVQSREVLQTITAHQQREGAGFLVRRPFPTNGLDHVDPFLMLDEVGPVKYGPGEAIGAPDHPHRGFETVSYILQGEKLHEDSDGHTQLLQAGDVQWMTAGAGIVHSEMPSERIQREGGWAHGFQIWVNLPRKDKWADPHYQHLPANDIPSACSEDGLVTVKVIAGEAFGVAASINTYTPIILQDWSVAPGGYATQPLDPRYQASIYVFEGEVSLGPSRAVVRAGQLARFGDGAKIEISAMPAHSTNARFLLLAGLPLGEEISRYGPFVMNTQQEIADAVDDYKGGKMGVISR